MDDARTRRTPPRFFAPEAAGGAPSIALPPDEAHHAARVLRLRRGDAVALFDGSGREWRAEVAEVGKAGVRVEAIEPAPAAPEPRVRLTLLQAVLKGDHMDAVVRDATMIGAAAIVPVMTARTTAGSAAAGRERARERWTRVAIASAKQCRRAVVPAIAAAARLEDALEEAAAAGGRRIVLVEPAAGRASLALDAAGSPPDRAALAIGPEGGWTAGELERFRAAGFTALTLGALTLRAEAAALVAISMLRAWWKDT